MNLCELSPEYVRAIAPYQPGKPISELAREMGLDESKIVKLASNENPLGPSPRALEAVRGALADLALYPDGNGFELKAALSRHYRIAPDRIVLGNGSNDLLDLAARVFLKPGAAAVYSRHAFVVYALVTQAMGALGILVPARNFGHDLEAMRRAITPETRMVFIANPNNPTGTLVTPAELLAFLRGVPEEVLVVLDEAYTEYLTEEQRGDSIAWLKEFPNLVVVRTFSKAYGLAGLRAGFALAAPGVADLMNRVRQPFNVNSLALVAAAAALEDAEFVRRSYQLNQAGMAQLTRGFKKLGLDSIPSYGNFVSVRVGDSLGVYQKLLLQGVIVRPVGGAYHMPEYLRVSIGLERENEIFLKALTTAIGA